MSSVAKRCYTVEEYLDFEVSSHDKHEFFQGEIFAMTGGSSNHNRIAFNIGAQLDRQLEGRPCQPFASDTRVKVVATGLYTYPDVTVACDPQFEVARLETLLNPKVLVEVLSPSTAAYDQRTKLSHYQQIPTAQEILFVAQDRYWVEHFFREAEGQWQQAVVTGLENELRLASIDCRLSLAKIYARVRISDDSE